MARAVKGSKKAPKGAYRHVAVLNLPVAACSEALSCKDQAVAGSLHGLETLKWLARRSDAGKGCVCLQPQAVDSILEPRRFLFVGAEHRALVGLYFGTSRSPVPLAAELKGSTPCTRTTSEWCSACPESPCVSVVLEALRECGLRRVLRGSPSSLGEVLRAFKPPDDSPGLQAGAKSRQSGA